MNIFKKPSYFALGIILFFIIMTGSGLYIKFVSSFEPKITLVYAKTDIPNKTLITADMVEEKEVPLSSNNKYAIKSKNDVIGNKSVAPIFQDELILSTRYSKPDQVNGVNIKDKNNRIFTLDLKADEANGWQIHEDSYVDLIFVPNPTQKQNPIPSSSASYNNTLPPQQGQMPISATNFDESQIVRLSKIRVAAIIGENNQVIDPSKDKDIIPKYVSFEVTTNQDTFLSWAKQYGHINVSLTDNLEGK